jgi:YgiT-type zinc finger domain-containing protein
MKCVLCRSGETQPGRVSVTLERGDSVVVVKDVPAEICRQCGEYYLDEGTTAKVMAMAEDAVKRHAEVEILRYAA